MESEAILSQQQLLELWRGFTKNGTEPNSDSEFLRPITIQSWKRCKDIGVDPRGIQFRILSKQDLETRREENADLIKISRPYLECLSKSLSGKPHVVALSDKNGWIIDLLGTPEMFGGRESGICLGASWNEKAIGNNGIGTALVLGEPVMVVGVEHYSAAYHGGTCLGVPIKNQGQVVGAIDVTVPNKYAHPARLGLTCACVASIEQSLNFIAESRQEGSEDEGFSSIGRLLATTVHDLKNPLTAIKALSQIGLDLSEEILFKEIYGKIIEQIDDLVVMIDDVMNISQMEEFAECSISQVLQELIEQFTPLCYQREIEIEFTTEGEIIIPLREKLFRRAIQNLLGNAIEAMPGGGRLLVILTRVDERVIITIVDTGAGIPKELQEDVFTPFVSSRETGKGLGLYMVHKAITQGHGGKISFQSVPGEGTAFFIELPTSVNQEISALQKKVENVVQLKCSLCDNWKGNGGPCVGRENCEELRFSV